MRKVFVILLGLLLVGGMVFANGGAEKAPEAVQTGTNDAAAVTGKNTFVEGGTPLNLWTFQELHVKFYTTMADEWNKAHPDKPINLTVTTGDSTAVHTKLLVAMQSGTGAPDVCDIEIGHYGTFLAGNYLLPLNDVVAPYAKDVVMSRIKMYGDQKGNWYGIDFHVGASVAYYNMDIMNAAGVDPSTIVTWDDYYNAGLKVLQKTGKPMCAVEVGDLFFPQLMMLEKKAQYVTDAGVPDIDTQAHVDVINFIKKMLDAGICIIAPGGGYHTEEWYGFFDKGGVASLCMPLWYMGRFTDYMTDLKGKMGIYEVPVWKKGDTRCVLQGGTGTSITKQSKHPELAKEFLAFAKLSDVGNRYIWNVLGFDPIRTSLWTDPTITQDKNNKFLQFFKTNPFDILNDVGADLTAPNISGGYAATYSVLVSTTYENVFEAEKDKDTASVLKQEQASIIYDK
ncbi:MAG: extracellular solute-binding protein [Sphaerochaetaceae bacterium]